MADLPVSPGTEKYAHSLEGSFIQELDDHIRLHATEEMLSTPQDRLFVTLNVDFQQVDGLPVRDRIERAYIDLTSPAGVVLSDRG
jgi:hypothetical protein